MSLGQFETTALGNIALKQSLGSDRKLLGAGGAVAALGGEHLVTRPTYSGLASLLPRHWVSQVRALTTEHRATKSAVVFVFED